MSVTIGQHDYKIDPKHRLVVPPRYREALHAEKGSHFILAHGMDGCIWLFLPSQWENLMDDLNERSKSFKNGKETRAYKRYLYSSANEATLDDQGRLLVPALLVQHAKIKKDVSIVGAGNKAEIWDTKTWEAYKKKQAAPSFEKLAQDLDI
jgi:MraZ protein